MNVGVIPDGNRRYARSQDIDKFNAYEEAKETIKEVTNSLQEYSSDLESITFYLLSEENFKRDEEDLNTLYELLDENIKEMAEFFEGKNFNVNWATTKPEALPERIREKLKDIENKFNEGDITVNLLVSYSGKEDILQAGREISGNGGKFVKSDFSKHLEIKNEIDLVIRTGDNPDRECLSGFPIWNSSYAEFYHVKKNFPAVEPGDIEEALEHFKNLRRKKGE